MYIRVSSGASLGMTTHNPVSSFYLRDVVAPAHIRHAILAIKPTKEEAAAYFTEEVTKSVCILVGWEDQKEENRSLFNANYFDLVMAV